MLRRIVGNLYFLTFLNGFLLASLFYFRMESNYEKELYKAIQLSINSKIDFNDNQDSLVVKAMQASHSLLADRQMVFQGKFSEGLSEQYIQPASVDLMTAKGACGSYSYVLSRILQTYDYPVRIAQMKVKEAYAAHNIVEVKTNSGWVVLDPLYNLFFIKPGGKGLASFADVQNNWNFYKTQLPQGYNLKYCYNGVRYSNWTKIPIFLPATKKMLDFVLGKEKADTISMRTLFLQSYSLLYFSLLLIYLPILLVTTKKIIKIAIFPQPNIPFNLQNVYLHLKASLRSRHIGGSFNT